MTKKIYNNAFTLVEMLVAMTLLVILVGLSSVVFSTTVRTHRTAMATIEITQKLNAITSQLNMDFMGLRKDAPLMFWFEPIGSDDDGSGTVDADEYFYYDMTHFFADGDFQTMRPYAGDSIYGNIARVFYGHANSDDLVANPALTTDFDIHEVLTRKSHILSSDGDIFSVYGEIPLITDGGTGLLDYSEFAASFGQDSYTLNYPNENDENDLEFCTISLGHWIAALNYLNAGSPDNADAFINYCMDDGNRPYVDVTDTGTQHLLMSQGVIDLEIQWAYTPDDLTGTVAGFTAGVRWWPSVDPDGDGNMADSDFASMPLMTPDTFGVYFALPNGTNTADWFAIDNCVTNGVSFLDTFYPIALKFTFRLKDSNDIFPDGRRFTHIVYLDN